MYTDHREYLNDLSGAEGATDQDRRDAVIAIWRFIALSLAVVVAGSTLAFLVVWASVRVGMLIGGGSW